MTDLYPPSVSDLRQDLRDRLSAFTAEFPAGSATPKELWAAQYDAGLARVEFPIGYGGLGLSEESQEVAEECFNAAGYPRREVHNLVGVFTVAPTLVAVATQTQLDDYLRNILTCRQIWCQLFSEPGAGSDLASLSTRAVRDGDEWIIDGQKVWTTMAHRADLGLLLARTDPAVPKHAGITAFIIDMHAPGIDVRPLRQITGEAEYNEVFLSNVRVSDGQRLGEVDKGWHVALEALNNERHIGNLLVRQDRESGPIDAALSTWRAADATARTAVLRDQLMRLWIDAKVLQLTTSRADSMRRAGQDASGVSVGHMRRGSLKQDIAEFCMDVRGVDATLIDDYAMVRPNHFTAVSGNHSARDLTKAYLASRSLTIAGGSAEISRNVLGERVLGLPKEPRPEADGAHRESDRRM